MRALDWAVEDKAVVSCCSVCFSVSAFFLHRSFPDRFFSVSVSIDFRRAGLVEFSVGVCLGFVSAVCLMSLSYPSWLEVRLTGTACLSMCSKKAVARLGHAGESRRPTPPLSSPSCGPTAIKLDYIAVGLMPKIATGSQLFFSLSFIFGYVFSCCTAVLCAPCAWT